MTPDQAKDAYYRETKQMAVKRFAIARWDRLSVERRAEEHARFEAACSWIDRQKTRTDG